MCDIAIASIAFTSFHYVPSYKAGHLKVPFVNISHQGNNLVSVQWPVCNDGKDVTDHETCSSSWPVVDQSTFLTNLSELLDCNGESIIIPDELAFTNITEIANGSFCQLFNEDFATLGNRSR